MNAILAPCEVDLRDAFFDTLHGIAAEDRNVMLLTDDQGAFGLGKFKNDMPEQYVNVGIAEQNLTAVAAGLAMGGKLPFIYGISTFITMRCFEQIRVDLCCMNLPVTIIGSGPGFTYGSDGPTHHATQDIAMMRLLPEMTIWNPNDAVSTASMARMAYSNKGPKYVRLEKGTQPRIYDYGHDFSQGFELLRVGSDLTITATGIMVQRAIEIADQLGEHGIDVGVLDLYRIKPVNSQPLCTALSNVKAVVTLEENSIVGGIGSLIAELFIDNHVPTPLKRIAIPDHHCYAYGGRDWLHEKHSLDVSSVSTAILKWPGLATVG